ncbi:MAG: sugar phosphate isomerase/epimerase [Rhodobacterales bacterium]|nr:sugar phosphate isomerase/epimerase [Rhodobacterales bacterium]
MRLSLCNEVLRHMPFPAQCEMAAALGYDGLEIAPFTLDPDPHLLTAMRRAEVRRAAADAGIAITGLHWLLVTPRDLSLNGPDDDMRFRTIDVMERLVGLCADLGGSVLVHGSPHQRGVPEGDDPTAYWDRAVAALSAAAEAAEAAGVTYCLEPLSRAETNFVNTVAEAARLVSSVGSPALRTMIDTSAAGQTEDLSVPDLIRRWLPTGVVAHVQLNDTNRRGPGQGDDDMPAILQALLDMGYGGVAAVEPFIYAPDGPTTAARSIGYLRGVLDSLTPSSGP